MPYGIDQDEWNDTVQEIISILAKRAEKERGNETISYSEPEDRRFHHMLGEVSKNEYKMGRGMLSVLVVHKTGDQKPGPGFFELARELGYVVADEDEFWISEFNKVCEARR